MGKNIRVVLIDDHPVVRQGIARLIQDEDGIDVCGEAGNADDAINVINRENPDVAIVDIYLDGKAVGIDLIKAIKERFPGIASIVLSMHNESTYGERAMRAGARGYIPKNEAPGKILEAIKRVMAGELFISKEVADRLINKLISGNSEKNTDIDVLTNRELEIFQMLGNGNSIKEIAKKLNLSKNTIESHRRNIKEKLKIETNSDLIKTAAQWIISNKI